MDLLKITQSGVQEVFGENLEPDYVRELINFILTNGNSIILLGNFIAIPLLFYLLWRKKK